METEQTSHLRKENTGLPIHEKEPRGSSLIHLFLGFVDRLNEGIAFLAGFTLVSMMLLIVFNAIKRLFSAPFAGTVEVVGWLAALTVAFSLGYTQLHKMHVYIDLLVNKFPSIIQKVTHTLMNLLSIAFFSITGWQLILYGVTLMRNNTVSVTLQVPFYPLVIISSIGFFSLVLALIKETIIIWGRVNNGS